jgi:hypothetical protein
MKNVLDIVIIIVNIRAMLVIYEQNFVFNQKSDGWQRPKKAVGYGNQHRQGNTWTEEVSFLKAKWKQTK